MAFPAARLTDQHLCPLATPGTPPVPHVGGPISGPGATTTLIAGLPAALVGDLAVCVGPPDAIAAGSYTALIEGRPSVRVGDQCVHGGVVASGCPTVLIGNSGGAGSPQAATMAAARGAATMFTELNCNPAAGANEATEPPPPTGTDWIEIELLDDDGEPVADERYLIRDPSGANRGGFTDHAGVARVEGIASGQCEICFPDLDAGVWRPL